ncbi:hypothetical protein TD95_001753 [Thielaviopsis punctulata]|uniref:Xylanolytic transcriptional activator regulatory domain-containing protein n=1 Tax=Thielaviopsis punctulata TaxID=72032 RepID=A0A0F4Z736_9PEZI|nr:hypothetical protein TD95_001753 [Thielaviopsis punctulata]
MHPVPRKPVRSSFSHNPLLRVSRPEKCDGKLPACTACEKAGREAECSSANDQFARGKERSYVAALELRIEKLERRLAFARSRKGSVNMPDISHDNDRKGSLAVIQEAMHRKAERRRENSDVNSLVSDFGYLSVNATARDFEFNATNMTFARLVLAAATNEFIHPPMDPDLPAKDTMVACLQFYLNNIFCLFPCCSEQTLWETMDDLLESESDGRIIKDSDCFLFWVCLALGATAQSRQNGDQLYNMGIDYVARALPYADRAMTPGYESQIQSLVLLTQYAMLDPAHFDAWHLIGFASRAAIDLGYHQDPAQILPGERSKLSQRRRIFYCVYSLDRAISMVHARAFSFTDDAMSVVVPKAPLLKSDQPPVANNGAPPTGPAPPALIQPAQYLFQMRRTQSLWYQTLFQSDGEDLPDPPSFIWKMCSDMKDWNSNLPSTQPNYIAKLFDLELRYSYVYCIAPSSRAPQITDYGRVLIFEHTTAYLETIHRVVNAPSNAAFYTYHDALKVYFMASQFLAVLRGAEDMLLMGAPVPVPVVNPGCPPPLPLPSRVYLRGRDEENLDRSLRVLQLVVETLELYGKRWSDALSLMQNFQMISAEVVQRLQVKQQMRDSARSREGKGQSQA